MQVERRIAGGESLSLDHLPVLFVRPREFTVVEEEGSLGIGRGGRGGGDPLPGFLDGARVTGIHCEVCPFSWIIPVIVHFPLSSRIANDAVVHAADCDMTRFLNGDGGTLSCFARFVEPGDETDAVQLLHAGQAAQFDESGEDIDQADRLQAALSGLAGSRCGDEKGNARGFLPQGALVPVLGRALI